MEKFIYQLKKMEDMFTQYAIEQSGLHEMIRLRRAAERQPTRENIAAARLAELNFQASEWAPMTQVFPGTRSRHIVYGGAAPPMTARETEAYLSFLEAADARRHLSLMNDWLVATQKYSWEFREQNPTYRHLKKRAKITQRRAIDSYSAAGDPRRLREIVFVPYRSARLALNEYGGKRGPSFWMEENEVDSASED